MSVTNIKTVIESVLAPKLVAIADKYADVEIDAKTLIEEQTSTIATLQQRVTVLETSIDTLMSEIADLKTKLNN
jgi:cell division protein FtsB